MFDLETPWAPSLKPCCPPRVEQHSGLLGAVRAAQKKAVLVWIQVCTHLKNVLENFFPVCDLREMNEVELKILLILQLLYLAISLNK